jgi:hypothetical protein
MKIANPLTRTPKPAAPDPTAFYVTATGFVVDVPGYPSWSPKIGTRVRGNWPGIVYLFSIGASHLFIPEGDDIAASEAYGRETFKDADGPVDDHPGITLGQPSTHVMVSTKGIQVGASLIAPGTLADAGDALVRRFPSSWEPAPASAYTD